MKKFITRCREWAKNHPGWELICDIEDSGKYYTQWKDLTRKERMYWIGTYRREGKSAFEEFGTKECKVEIGVIDCNMILHEINDWPNGLAMTVLKTADYKK